MASNQRFVSYIYIVKIQLVLLLFSDDDDYDDDVAINWGNKQTWLHTWRKYHVRLACFLPFRVVLHS